MSKLWTCEGRSYLESGVLGLTEIKATSNGLEKRSTELLTTVLTA